MEDRSKAHDPNTRDQRRAVGREAERRVARHLIGRGWRILARNWRIGAGEIDLICLTGRTIVFVEVKALRSGSGAGPERPVLAVGPNKRERLVRLAGAWIGGPGRSHAGRWDEVRFDVIGIDFGSTGRAPEMEHLVDAFRPEDAPFRRPWRRRRGLR